MSNEQEKFFELQAKFEKKEISKMEFFTNAEKLVRNSSIGSNKSDLIGLLEQARAKYK